MKIATLPSGSHATPTPEAKSETSLGLFLPYDSATFIDYYDALCKAWRDLPPEQQRHRVHQHFGLGSVTLNFLEMNFPVSKTTSFTSCFYDTAKSCLARQNRWLIYQEGAWALKSCKSSSSEDVVVFHTERDQDTIEEEVARVLCTSRADVKTLCPLRYAIIRTTRRTYYSSNGCTLYVDAAQLGPDDYYLVGTLSLLAEGDSLVANQWPELQLLDGIFTPVRSRVVEFIYAHNLEFYKELVGTVIPKQDYFSRHDWNRRTRNPFGTTTCTVRPADADAVVSGVPSSSLPMCDEDDEDDEDSALVDPDDWDEDVVRRWNERVKFN